MATYRYTNPGSASLQLNDRPLYGSSRLGTFGEEMELHSLLNWDPADPVVVDQVDLNYELTDHLGIACPERSRRVCAVVTGRLMDGNGGGTLKQAELVSAQGYEPGGSLLPGRNYSSSTYDYGFNGMRKDDEIHGATGTSYDFGARLLDVRVGRWMSLDAKGSLFPGMTPYGFAAGNPIFYRDKDGNIIEPTDEKSRNQFNGAVTALFTSDGVVNETVVNMLTITGPNLSGLTQEDYNTAMSTLNDPDQRAAFHGLFLAANSETAYRLTTISDGESAVVNDVEVSARRLQMESKGVASHRNDRLSSIEGMNQVVDVAVSLESAGALREGALRSGPAMVVGGLLAAFVHNDEYTALGNWNTRPLTEEIGITQLQTENMVMRATGAGQLTGGDFLRPDDSEFGAKLGRVKNIPDQLRYQGKAFTYDPYVERDVTTTDQ